MNLQRAKTDIGRQGEIFITELSAQTLFFDFIHERPTYQKENGPKREICDLLAVLDGQALPIQIKTQSPNALRTNNTEARWFRNKIKKASRQVSGSLRIIETNEIRAVNRIRDIIHFPQGSLSSRHGIALFDIIKGEQSIPDEVTHSTPNNQTIHYFSFLDFLNLLKHLRTFPDLIYYLDQRAQLAPHLKPALNKEKDAYAFFLTHKRSFNDVSQKADFNGTWDRLTGINGGSFELKLREDKYSLFVDLMIKEVHVIDPHQDEYTPSELLSSYEDMKREYFEIATELNRLPLMERREIGKRIFDKAQSAAKIEEPRYFICLSPANPNTVFAFLVSHLPRKDWIRLISSVLRVGMAKLGINRGVGVALNDASLPGHAFNFVFIDGLDVNNPELLKFKDKLFGEIKNTGAYDFPDQNPDFQVDKNS
jgi:hypothetical protein